MNTGTAPGYAHFIAESGALGQGLLAVLALMSVVTWTIVATQALARWQQGRRARAFLDAFWNAESLDAVAAGLARRGGRDPYSQLATQALHAQRHHARHGASRLADAGSAAELVARTLRQGLDDEATQVERGLTALATIGATAPFVGLFGTVWGVYHALLAIGLNGAGTLDQVAGPVGEALVMTGLGLAVAIPAVIGYNALTRGNRVLLSRLEAFAHELHTFVSTGQPLSAGAEPAAAAATVRALPSRPATA